MGWTEGNFLSQLKQNVRLPSGQPHLSENTQGIQCNDYQSTVRFYYNFTTILKKCFFVCLHSPCNITFLMVYSNQFA